MKKSEMVIALVILAILGTKDVPAINVHKIIVFTWSPCTIFSTLGIIENGVKAYMVIYMTNHAA